MVSLANFSFKAFSSNTDFCSVIAASISFLITFKALPAAIFSSSGNAPKPFICSVSLPFLPKTATRISSNSFKFAAALIFVRVSFFNSSKFSIICNLSFLKHKKESASGLPFSQLFFILFTLYLFYFLRAALAVSTNLANAWGSFKAISARTLRSSSTPALISPLINRE